MADEDLKKSLDKYINYEGLGFSNMNEFEKEYNDTIRMNKFRNLIESINIKEGEEPPEVLNVPVDSEKEKNDDRDSIFFKKLRSDVIKPE